MHCQSVVLKNQFFYIQLTKRFFFIPTWVANSYKLNNSTFTIITYTGFTHASCVQSMKEWFIIIYVKYGCNNNIENSVAEYICNALKAIATKSLSIFCKCFCSGAVCNG